MAREHPDFRETLARLDQAYPSRETLSHTEIAAWLGVSTRTVRRRYSFPQGRVNKVQIARAVTS